MPPETVSDLLVASAAAAYAGSFAGFVVHVAHREGSPRASLSGRIALWIAAALHSSFVLHYAFGFQVCPVKTIHLAISLGVLVAVFVFLVARIGPRASALGLFVAPIALCTLLASRFVRFPAVPETLHNRLLPLHVTANVVGDGLFVIAAAAAALYLFQARQLKNKRGGRVVGRIPPLDTLDRIEHRLLSAGFVFMTIGAVTGTVWIAKLGSGTALEVARTLLGYLTWVLFCAVLLLRATLGWRGRRAAIGTLAGFALSIVVVALYLLGAGSGAP